MKIEKGEDCAFISEAADRLMPFGGAVKLRKFDESPALVARNATLVPLTSSLSDYEEDWTRRSTTSSLSSNSSSISTSSILSGSSDFEFLASL